MTDPTDTRPSIAELRDAPQEFTDAELDDWAHRIGPAARPDMMVGALIAEVKRHRSAVPVLLEIAAAELALREQEQVAAKARRRVYAALEQKLVAPAADYEASDVEDRKLARCREAYQAAIAKVRP